jgi:hypothetical protein
MQTGWANLHRAVIHAAGGPCGLDRVPEALYVTGLARKPSPTAAGAGGDGVRPLPRRCCSAGTRGTSLEPAVAPGVDDKVKRPRDRSECLRCARSGHLGRPSAGARSGRSPAARGKSAACPRLQPRPRSLSWESACRAAGSGWARASEENAPSTRRSSTDCSGTSRLGKPTHS